MPQLPSVRRLLAGVNDDELPELALSESRVSRPEEITEHYSRVDRTGFGG